MSTRRFLKMHGLGNDFVIFDARREPLPLSEAQAAAIADRRRGVGCDQVIAMEPPQDGGADLFMRIWNNDGSEAGACGNATRCVAALLFHESGKEKATIQTLAGLLPVAAAADGLVSVDMGEARFGWREIPLAREMDTEHLELSYKTFSDPVGLNIGNPHAVFFVETPPDDETLTEAGAALERDSLFPERTNVQFVQVLGRERLRQRVWERGAGITQASGSGACAGAAAAVRRGLTERRVTTEMDGGEMILEVRADWHVVMTGPVALAYAGEVEFAE
ncbi:MAG: diaminopimelate epimerase [Rhodovibrionaceae bacterium]